MKNKIWIVGMGPGNEEMMTGRAIEVLEQVDVIIGYTVYLDLLGERFQDKEFLSTPMRQEEKRSNGMQRRCRCLWNGITDV